MINKKDFSEHPLVIKFITKFFDRHYSKSFCPKWVDFEMFKHETIKKMLKKLYFSVVHEKNYQDHMRVHIPFENFMVAYTSDRFDARANSGFEQCSTAIYFGGIGTIPHYIFMIYKGEDDEDAITKNACEYWKKIEEEEEEDEEEEHEEGEDDEEEEDDEEGDDDEEEEDDEEGDDDEEED